MTNPIKMLLSPNLCRLCGQGTKDDDDRLEIRGFFVANICAPCQQDYLDQHHEAIEETLKRGIHPRDVLPFRRSN
jgi:hypothetical protein